METSFSPRILIIDDEERNRKILDVFIRAEGYSTMMASNGADALVMAKTCPDAILLDLMMPGMDGFQIVRGLKSDAVTCEIPIIIVSALDDMAARRRMLAAGADEFIGKPVDRWELSLRLSKLLQNQPGSNELND